MHPAGRGGKAGHLEEELNQIKLYCLSEEVHRLLVLLYIYIVLPVYSVGEILFYLSMQR